MGREPPRDRRSETPLGDCPATLARVFNDEKDAFAGGAVAVQVEARPIAVVAQLRSHAPRLVATLGRLPFWSAWTGRLIADHPWSHDAVASQIWLQVGDGGDVGVAFVADVIRPTPLPLPAPVAELLAQQSTALGLRAWTSHGLIEHRSIVWIVGGNSPPFGPTGMPGSPPPAGDREPRHPLPVTPAASAMLDLP